MIDHHATDPSPRRFDERGIALQTIIIIVVLISIAGAIALVLFNRASDETERLEQTETIYDRIDTHQACTIAGGRLSKKTLSDPFDAGAADGNDYKSCWPPT